MQQQSITNFIQGPQVADWTIEQDGTVWIEAEDKRFIRIPAWLAMEALEAKGILQYDEVFRDKEETMPRVKILVETKDPFSGEFSQEAIFPMVNEVIMEVLGYHAQAIWNYVVSVYPEKIAKPDIF